MYVSRHRYVCVYVCIYKFIHIHIHIFELVFCFIYIYIYTHTHTYIYVYVYVLEKAMAPHSSTFVWKIPWTEEPGRLQSMGSWRVKATSFLIFTFMHWKRKWQSTLVFLPREFQGRGSLVGCRLWGHTELDMTEQLHFQFLLSCIGEGNGNPLQCSWLENSRDGEAWWAAVYGVAQSRTRLKRLSSGSNSSKLLFCQLWSGVCTFFWTWYP